MRISLRYYLIVVAVLSFVTSEGQSRLSFDEFNTGRQKRFDEFKEEKRRKFEAFRRKRNEEFAKFMRKDWVRIDEQPVVPVPKDEVFPPVVVPENDVPPVAPVPTPVPFDEVIPVPKPQPQPEPIDPILEIPIDTDPVEPEKEIPPTLTLKKIDFSFFGTPASVRLGEGESLKLKGVDENSVADAWLRLSEDAYTNLVYDCIQLRENLQLDDWPYLMMLQRMGEAVCGKGTNEATLLTAYVYCQSGYKMRLGAASGKLYLLYASEHSIYDMTYFKLDGEDYYIFGEGPSQMHICDQGFPKERSMSLLMNRQPKLAMQLSTTSTHTSTRHPDMSFKIEANKNMLKFYDSYPTSIVDGNMMTRWAMYANMPMPEHIKNELYPKIKEKISGLGQLESLNKILHWVQTGFAYEYDDKVWGHDRAFFPEESLHYPYCDCEDRSIMFSRIVRDVLGLKCVLVFYPGHLAAAVAVTAEGATGDYFDYKGSRFFITDGTIMGYGASVGQTMRGMDNAKAKLILLD